MSPETAARLVELNRRFYDAFSHPFSQTRLRLQPGVKHLLDRIPANASVLDLGCGNGNAARYLFQHGYCGSYLGLDMSSALLEEAKLHAPTAVLKTIDLADPDWIKNIPCECFDYILAFAVLHHIPGDKFRLQILNGVHDHIKPSGYFFHSHWQFLNDQRLYARIQSWELAGISNDDIDQGDYLLDWRQGGVGLRYVHFSSQEVLIQMAKESRFRVHESFYSDGRNGDLGLYQVWVYN